MQPLALSPQAFQRAGKTTTNEFPEQCLGRKTCQDVIYRIIHHGGPSPAPKKRKFILHHGTILPKGVGLLWSRVENSLKYLSARLPTCFPPIFTCQADKTHTLALNFRKFEGVFGVHPPECSLSMV